MKSWISDENFANIKKRQNFYPLDNKIKYRINKRSRCDNFSTIQIRQAEINYFTREFDNSRNIVKTIGNEITKEFIVKLKLTFIIRAL